MAYEKEMIAAMNNPNTFFAWRCAERLFLDRDYWMASANRWKNRLWEVDGERSDRVMELRTLDRKLEAARAENVAVHKDLGEAYECIRLRDLTFLDDVAKYVGEARRWKRVASRLQISLVTLLSLWLVVVQALLLRWL